MTSTDIHALAGAYALDAVDDLERAAFDRHLASCESCRGEIDEFRETAARLADSTWSVPPPRLRADVLAAIARTRQLPAVAPARPRSAGSGWRRWGLGVAAAVVLALGVGTTVYVVEEQRIQDQRQATAAAAQQASAAQQQAVAAARQSARVRQILAAPDLVVRTGPILGGGKVTVASSVSLNAGVLLMGADAAPTGGRVYELWTIRGQTPSKAAVLTVGQTNAVQVVEGLPGSAAVGVTAEPAGGSTTPTLPLVANVALT
jgi:anti-sigma factor RsiW